jgi:alpha-tubulin suppressor-like RCC1 family protein
VTAIAVGGFHSCALINGGVKCWGYNGQGQLGNGSTNDAATPQAVGGLASGVVAIAAGQFHTCAILTAGTIRCWGRNGNGQLGDGSVNPTGTGMPSTVSNIASGATAVTAGAAHTCAIVAGGLQCWGRNPEGQLDDASTSDKHVPSPSPTLTSGILAIAAGGYHTCAILTGGELRCWGWNGYGQLGDNTLVNTNANPAVAVSGLASGVTSVGGGFSHTCAIVAGAAKCWGYNNFGQLGNGTLTDTKTPVAVTGIASGATAVQVGLYSSCAQVVVSAVSQLNCWGLNANGQLGRGDLVNRLAPTTNPLTSGVSALLGGSSGTTQCAVVSGAAQCWGYGEDGQLGNGIAYSRNVPVQVSGLTSGVTAIAGGTRHVCAVVNGAAVCWGTNASGQLGNNSTARSLVPVQVSGLTSGVTAISTGYAYSCAIVGTGVKCWGANPDGELGDGTIGESHVPVSVTGLTGTPIAISSGVAHTCVVHSDGSMQCWGYNVAGQLGNNSTASTSNGPPVAVSGISSGATAVAAGGYHTCAIVSGAAKCWGEGTIGELGNGAGSNSPTPVGVSGLSSGVSAIGAGGHHSCAVAGGAVSCWGSGYYGQLGNSLRGAHAAPVAVTGLTSGVTAVSGIDAVSCAIVSGAVQCWGTDGYGAIGDGRVVRQLLPALVVRNDTLFSFGFELY